MAPRIEANVRGELLVWARQTAGFTPEHAAKKLKVPTAELLAWERDEKKPSVPQLRKAANLYKRPLAAFFLPRPPESPEPLHDFRRLYGEADHSTMSPELLLEMRRARRRRQVAVELMEEVGNVDRPTLVRADINDNPDLLAAKIRELLGISLDEQETWNDDHAALKHWITAIERLGILVFQTGNVPLKEMRGFSISEDVLPVVVLNAKDRPRGRIFTLMHEFVHLLLHDGGICDPMRARRTARSTDERVEAFCNRVAGAVLVPAAALLADGRVQATAVRRPWDDDDIKAVADRFMVSRDVILRRLLIANRITADYYDEQYNRLRAHYDELAKPVPGKKMPIPYYRKALRNNGLRYTRLVIDAYEQERIGPSAVVEYLGAKLTHLDRITEAARHGVAEDHA